MTHEEVCYSPKELLDFSVIAETWWAWEWILLVWDNGGKNIHLDQAELVNTSPLSRDSEFNVAVHGVKVLIVHLPGWQKMPTVNELEMSDILLFTADEGIKRLRKMEML